METIDIDIWNKKPILSKLKFEFLLIHNNFFATYFSKNNKYCINFEFGETSRLEKEMTAKELYSNSYDKFKLEKLY